MKLSSARLDFEDGRLDNAFLKQYGETVVGGVNGTNAGSSYEIDLSAGNVFHLILNSSSCAFTIANPKASATMSEFTVFLRQDTTGGRAATWPGAVKWPGGVTPTLSSIAEAVNVFSFMSPDAGTTWLAIAPGTVHQAAGL